MAGSAGESGKLLPACYVGPQSRADRLARIRNPHAESLDPNFDTGDPRSEFTPSLLGFYATSTGVGVFAAIAAVAFVVLPEFEAAAEVADTIGWVFYLKGVYPTAAIHLQGAARNSPDNAVVHYHLAMAQAKAGNMGAARRAYEEGMRLNSGLAEANIITPEDLRIYYGRQSRSEK